VTMTAAKAVTATFVKASAATHAPRRIVAR
jgi:hypothetical protein